MIYRLEPEEGDNDDDAAAADDVGARTAGTDAAETKPGRVKRKKRKHL